MTALGAALRVFRIQVTGPSGTGEMDVPAFSEATAKTRAFWTAAHLRWGDVDELEVTSCVEVYVCCAHCSCPAGAEGHPVPCTKCEQPLIRTADQQVAHEMAAGR